MASNEEIKAAIEELVARGEKASVRKIWAHLGNSGSFIQIQPVLKAWRMAQAAKSAEQFLTRIKAPLCTQN